MAGLRIAYAGTPEFAVPALQGLLASHHEIVAVITQPDRPSGRGRRLTASPVKLATARAEISLMQPENINLPEARRQIADLMLDLIVVAAYGQIFSSSLLAIPRLGCVNIHASLLPRWRGAAPIQHAILAGDEKTGISIMQMKKEMDAGDIWHQDQIPIEPEDTTQSLHDRLAKLSAASLMTALEKILDGHHRAVPQVESEATYCSKLVKTDGEIDWYQSAQDIVRKVRAFYPWPGSYTQLDGRRLQVIQAREEQDPSSNRIPGSIVQADKAGMLVQCGQGAVQILTVIPAGGKRMSANDFANSNQLNNKVLGSRTG